MKTKPKRRKKDILDRAVDLAWKRAAGNGSKPKPKSELELLREAVEQLREEVRQLRLRIQYAELPIEIPRRPHYEPRTWPRNPDGSPPAICRTLDGTICSDFGYYWP